MSQLFLAEVVSVHPSRIINTQQLNGNTEAEVQYEAYTIDVKPFAGRSEMQGVRVLSPSSGTNKENGSGFIWMPSIGDWVVCGYLENFPDFAICFGTIKHPHFNILSSEGQGYEDFIIHHQSDSWIRIRDLSKYNDPSNKESTSEIKIHHKDGAEIQLVSGDEDCEINITHPNGSKISLTSDGISIESEKVDITTDLTTINGEEQSAVLGNLFKTVFDKLIIWLNSHPHNGNLGFPTAPPITSFSDTTNYLSEKTKLG